MTKKNIALVVLMIIAACAALVYGLSFIPKRGAPGNPEYTKSVVQMGPITIVEWNHRFEGENITRIYDEQTHMVFYLRNSEALGGSTLDLGILPEEMMSGADTPVDDEILELPDEPEAIHGH